MKQYTWNTLKRNPILLIRISAVLLRQKCRLLFQRFLDRYRSSYSSGKQLENIHINCYLRPIPIEKLSPYSEQIASLSKLYIEHRFDLLGSGWVQVRPGMFCRGLEGHRYDMDKTIKPDSSKKWFREHISSTNLHQSRKMQQIVDNAYSPIDWHIDFKSGYRWSALKWYKDINNAPPGADVKVPLELSRMQHLATLAWAYALADTDEDRFYPKVVYLREFQNVIIDFISTNPPRFGVNWSCTMDVAVRIANCLIAYDIFKTYGAEFDRDFEMIFCRSTMEHGLHIRQNLEWHVVRRTNHYLANIVGLLFVSAYLSPAKQTNDWLRFSAQELVKEVSHQFYEDGTNFEASTSYHRLASEMVLYATALWLAVPTIRKIESTPITEAVNTPPISPVTKSSIENDGIEKNNTYFPLWFFQRLEQMAEFTLHITKQNGHVPQFGDNDSGRFFKILPVYLKKNVADVKFEYYNLSDYNELPDYSIYWEEDHLDHSHLVAGINGLYDRQGFKTFAADNDIETEMIKALSGNKKITSFCECSLSGYTKGDPVIGDDKFFSHLETVKSKAIGVDQKYEIKIPVPDGLRKDTVKRFAFTHFGLYLFRSERLYLAIRCGSIGQKGTGGHSHNDQLGIELSLDGKDIICDPGTYLYTALPERRNQYRSVKAHFAPQVRDREPGILTAGLFEIRNGAQASCLYFGPMGFIGVHYGFTDPVYRIIKLNTEMIHISDILDGNSVLENIYDISDKEPTRIPLSKGYGIRNA